MSAHLKSLVFFLVVLASAPHAHALSGQAQEFMAITGRLEPVQCEKRKLRREIALAEAENRDPQDLAAISRQQREAFYRCD